MRVKRQHPFLAAFQQLPVPADSPAITVLGGVLNAPILFLTEHPTDDEYENNGLMCSVAQRNYAEAMMHGGADVSADFLLMPFSRFGKKPNKASTVDTFSFLKENLHLLPQIKCVACQGMGVFGFVFAGGRKTHARSIIGNPMFLPQLYTLPVFVLPDSKFLSPNPDNFREVRFAREKMVEIANLTLNLLSFTKTLPPNANLRKRNPQG